MAIIGDKLSTNCRTCDADEHPFLEVLLMTAMTSSMVSSLKCRSGVLLSATSSSGYTVKVAFFCAK